MTKRDALALVAQHAGALLEHGGIDDLAFDAERLSDSDILRIEWAISEVAQRLFAIADRNGYVHTEPS